VEFIDYTTWSHEYFFDEPYSSHPSIGYRYSKKEEHSIYQAKAFYHYPFINGFPC